MNANVDNQSMLSFKAILLRALLLTPASAAVAYVLLLLFKESGGVLSDVGFALILPIALVGWARPSIPSGLFWPAFLVLQFGYVLLLVYLYYFIRARLRRSDGQEDDCN